MAKLQLNKSSLAREARNLRTYQRFLPSLDLKRQQLMAERAKAARILDKTRQDIRDLEKEIGQRLPMLANQNVGLANVATIDDVVLGKESLVGTPLPTLERVDVDIRPYALLAKPHWVDQIVEKLSDMLELRIRVQVEEQRLKCLDEAVKTITQRVNLFDKVLIPKSEERIRRIKIYLSDQEMAAVIRSKIAKRKHAEAVQT